MKNQTSKPVLRGRVVRARVRELSPTSASLSLVSVRGTPPGTMDLTARVPISLSLNSSGGKLRIDDELEVQVLFWSKLRRAWEVSKDAAQERKRVMNSFAKGDQIKGRLVYEDDTSLILELPRESIGLLNKERYGSAVYILRTIRKLQPGQQIPVVVNEWDPLGRGVILDLDGVQETLFEINSVVEGKVVHVGESAGIHRPGVFRFYAKTENNALLRLNHFPILRPRKKYFVGKVYPFRIMGKPHRGTWPVDLDIDWKSAVPDFGIFPNIGDIIDGVVTATSKSGARCLVSNGCYGWIPASCFGDGVEEASPYLFKSDTVQVRVVDVEEGPNGAQAKLELLRLVKRRPELGGTFQSEVIEPKAEKETRTYAGYTRDEEFRSAILQMYDYKCVFCRKRWFFGGYHAVQAAHIVPRAKKGANSLQNGVALCVFHHWAMDKGLITVSADGRIAVAMQVLASEENSEYLGELHGAKILRTKRSVFPATAFEWHRRHVFLDSRGI